MLIDLSKTSLEQLRELIAECSKQQLQQQLHRRTLKLKALMQNGHAPKTSDDVLRMSSLTEREASLPDAKFDALLWTISRDGKIISNISPTRFIKRAFAR